MERTIIIVFAVLISMQVKAQLLKKKSIDISIGLGLSAPYEDIDVYASGFYLQGEYVFELNNWVDVRPYAGLILTKSSDKDLNNNPTLYKSTTNAILIGGKTRITIPIPWVAPYFEVGLGASIGSFETFIPSTNIDKKGLIMHIPVSLGLELGPKHNIDIGLLYYFQPSVQQFSGAVAFGISFPLN